MIEVSQRTRVRSGSGRAEPAVLTFLRSLDWILMLAAAGLVGYGLWVVSGITRFDVPGVQDYFVVRQGIAAAIGAVGLVVAAIVPVDLWRRYWKVVYVMTLGLMVVVFVAAEAVRGSKRWLDLGFIQFQPSELGKVLFVLAIAGFVVDRAGAVTRWRTIFSAIGLGAIPILLVFAQPDLGTALVYSAALFAVLFFAGLRWRQLLALLAVGVIGITAVLWLLPAAGVQVLKPYQAARLTLDPDADPGGITYNLSQSITAVGSGGLTGRGVIGASQTRLDYLPEHATDFAFASLAEQRGLRRMRDPAPSLPPRRVARSPRHHRGGRSLRRRRRWRAGGRVPLPGLRQRRYDDGRCAGDGHSAPIRDRGRLVDGCEPRADRRPAEHSRSR